MKSDFGGLEARAAMLMLVLLAMPAQAVMYKWVDKQGRVNYGDDPPPGVKAEPLGDKGAVTVMPAPPAAPTAPAASGEQQRDERLDRLERELAAERAARQSLEYDAQARQADEAEARLQAIERCKSNRGVDCEINYERYLSTYGGVVTEEEWVLPNRRYHPRPLREADPGWGVKSWPGGSERPHRPEHPKPQPQTPPAPAPAPKPQPSQERPAVKQGLSVPQRPASGGSGDLSR